MRITGIRLQSFGAFRNVTLRDLPPLAVFIGANGTGKSTLVSVLQFLQDALTTNVTVAFGKLGGFQEVRSRGSRGPIEIELTLQENESVHTYALHLDEEKGRPFVERECLTRHLGEGRNPSIFDFRRGHGTIATGAATSETGEQDGFFEEQTLKSPDLLALKGLSQFARLPSVAALGTLLETWHFSKLSTSRARVESSMGNAEHLSREGENLSLVIDYLQKRHPAVLLQIIQRLGRRVPGLQHIESKVTEEGRVLLRFKDVFEDPFLARHVSDGTIKMLSYLVLFLDPAPYSLLSLEEPEHHLYPTLLSELVEQLRTYAARGQQVFVSTHSPDFLNAAELDEVFWLVKHDGATEIRRGRDHAQLKASMGEGDQLGHLWKQGLFDEEKEA